ncbi:MAG TPA: helix-turn-helix transcriptional regulator [Thermoanaerobacterales bacterium]|nr:helix-turn-helix transcriptional regulator [Thermoanaerobacterales bacterium]
MELSPRQEAIIEIVKENEPISSEMIADKLELSRAALRPDLAILTMTGILEARQRVGYYYSGKSIENFLSDHIKKIKVEDVKGVPIIIKENTSIYDAIVTIFLEDVGTLFVNNDDGYLSGIVSRKDLLKISIGNMELQKMPVGIIMSRMPNIITIEANDSVHYAAKKIVEHEIDALPVVVPVKKQKEENIKYKVVGKITKTNIAKLFVELGEIY